MTEWLANLTQRERWALVLGVIALAALALYGLVWAPLQGAGERLTERVERQEALLGWMRGAAREIEALRAGGAQSAAGTETAGSLLGTVDRTAASAGLGQQVRRVQPQAEGAVRVWLEGAAFDTLTRWLATLRAEQGIVAAEASIQRDEAPGKVTARLLLRRRGR